MTIKVLVAIAHYGTKNRVHAARLVEEYLSMPFEVEIVVLCESAKGFGPHVSELVGLPTKDPWSLPFGHRKLFIDNADNYDLFIYTEDDTLIREANVRAYLLGSASLPADMLPGFIRYECFPDGTRRYPDIHGPFHWVPGSVGRSGDYVYADFSNDHSACYMLTRDQLRRAIDSGGFGTAPHRGRYDLSCAAATDPYTQCGFRRVVCISHIQDFELHHLPNAYLNRIGLGETEYRLQLGALFEILDGKRSDGELFSTEKKLPTPEWDKCYYESCRDELLQYVSSGASRILTVGGGAGATELNLIQRGIRVTTMPLDAVVSRHMEGSGVRLLPPNFALAFEALADEQFDAILVPDVLQHLQSPVDILARLGHHLNAQGLLVGSVPNLGSIRRLAGGLARHGKWSGLDRDFENTGLQCTSAHGTVQWLEESGLVTVEVKLDGRAVASRLGVLSHFLPGEVTAAEIVFVARSAGV